MSILGPNGHPHAQKTPAPDAKHDAAVEGADLVKDATDQSFMQDVIEPSRKVPVLVDFWAPWCGPCRQLGPVLEHAVRQSGGKVRLVKINIDENPGIAGQLRIQSIPAVIAFQNGQPVDGFMGALPESQIRDFIKRISGDVDGEAIEALIERAEDSLAAGDLGGAAQDFATALQQDASNLSAVAGLARVYLASGDTEQAIALLDQVPEAKKSDPAIAGIRAAMELSTTVQAPDDLPALQSAAKGNPTSATALLALAKGLIAAGDLAGAADALLESIRLDRELDGGAARQLLLKVFDAAGPASELARAGRRRLSSVLFA